MGRTTCIVERVNGIEMPDQTIDRCPDAVVLRHAIGKSTFSEGFAVPKALEAWINAPEAGNKRSLTLAFDGQRCKATLRRLANERAHVQVKYRGSRGASFRNWLASKFEASKKTHCGEYLEMKRVCDDQYEVTAFTSENAPQSLAVCDWIFHRCGPAPFDTWPPLREIPAILKGVKWRSSEGQKYYNSEISRGFGLWIWDKEVSVAPELRLAADFLKQGVQTEVEFGNARTYYQDLIKFMLAHKWRNVQLGVLIVPSEQFASELCRLGRAKAQAKGRRSYSGMIHFEKVRRELPFLDFMIDMSLVVAGIGHK